MSLRNNTQYLERRVYELEADLAAERKAREAAERERDEEGVACEKYKQAASDAMEKVPRCAGCDHMRLQVGELVATLNRANDATTREEQRALAAEARLAAAVKAWDGEPKEGT